MKKQICLTSVFLMCFLCTYTAKSQNKADAIFGKIKTAIKLNQTCAQRHPTIYLNKREAILDFADNQIPLKQVSVVYFINNDAPQCGSTWIKFDCLDGNCITTPEGVNSAWGIPLKDKSKCYDLINLFADLQEALK